MNSVGIRDAAPMQGCCSVLAHRGEVGLRPKGPSGFPQEANQTPLGSTEAGEVSKQVSPHKPILPLPSPVSRPHIHTMLAELVWTYLGAARPGYWCGETRAHMYTGLPHRTTLLQSHCKRILRCICDNTGPAQGNQVNSSPFTGQSSFPV